MEYIHHYKSPLGGITMASDGKALTGLWFDGQKYCAVTLSKEHEKKMLPVFEAADRWLDIYFQGKEPDFLPPVSFACGSEFRQEVLGSVALRQEFIRLIHQEDGSYLV